MGNGIAHVVFAQSMDIKTRPHRQFHRIPWTKGVSDHAEPGGRSGYQGDFTDNDRKSTLGKYNCITPIGRTEFNRADLVNRGPQRKHT